MQEIKTYKTADLVLQVNKYYDPTKLNLTEWERYLDILCDNRPFQKEAIQKAIFFLASGLYKDIKEVVIENYNNPRNTEMQSRYSTLDDYVNQLQFPNKLAATIDLATGTGKSYVIYGIAQIMLGLGIVDRVLVLCPSLTIEDGLLEKFKILSQDATLLKAIPDESKWKNPSIKTAEVTIKKGDICIENIHAVYEKTGSSIRDSFLGNGERTLVLNDECHHIFNSLEGRDKESQNLKKWKEFLVSSEFNFKYILGFTGTAYTKDEYFNDVICRYSLRQAVNDKIVKMVDYVSKNDDADVEIKFQEIFDNHRQNGNLYRKVKPLTILITKDITAAKRLATELSDFLMVKEGLGSEKIAEKVLIVTSANEHKANVRKLKEVDNLYNKVEWIVSVSMLTEGWDVKNVFQIVPWEDRAFNSKLLIAQVLGRGLRIPPAYQNPQPTVKVFNHDAWSRNIRGLVDEILEIEMKLISSPLTTNDRSKYHFEVYSINYSRDPQEKFSERKHDEFDYTRGFIKLQSQVEDIEKQTEYTNLFGISENKSTIIHYATWTIDEVVNKIYAELHLREWEGKILKLPTGNYSKENLPPKEEINKIIRNSMDDVGIIGDRLTEINKLKIESSFSTLLRRTGKTTYYDRKAKVPYLVSTQSIERENLAVGNLRHNSTVFFSSNYATELQAENLEIMNAMLDDQTFPRSASSEVNSFIFKTPFDLVFSKFEPERKFIDRLCKNDNVQLIDAWVKNRDVGFYSIEYSITSIGGKHSKTQGFNPDFFIKVMKDEITHIFVVETKVDGDVDDENKAKLKYARQHFKDLNTELAKLSIKQVYHFHFLSPNSYDAFFNSLKNGVLFEDKFRSDLEDKLEEE
jgi:type III restriction enzyme